MTDVPEAARDVVAYLTFQHEQILGFVAATTDNNQDRRAAAFGALRRLIAVHETTEQEIVHPRARHELADGQALVPARLGEEEEIAARLGKLESLDLSSPSFYDEVTALESELRIHFCREEEQEFAGLRVQLGVRQLRRMANAVQLAAEASSVGGGRLSGPFTAMLEQAQYAISGCLQDAE